MAIREQSVPRASLANEVTTRLQGLAEQVEGVGALAIDLRDTLTGPQPENEASTGRQSGGGGVLGEWCAALAMLAHRLERAEDALRDVQSAFGGPQNGQRLMGPPPELAREMRGLAKY